MGWSKQEEEEERAIVRRVNAAVGRERQRWKSAARAVVLASVQGKWSGELAVAVRDLAEVHDAL